MVDSNTFDLYVQERGAEKGIVNVTPQAEQLPRMGIKRHNSNYNQKAWAGRQCNRNVAVCNDRHAFELGWCCHGFDMVLGWIWYDRIYGFGMMLLCMAWFWEEFNFGLGMKLARFYALIRQDCCIYCMVLGWCWAGFGMTLTCSYVWFWHDVVMHCIVLR